MCFYTWKSFPFCFHLFHGCEWENVIQWIKTGPTLEGNLRTICIELGCVGGTASWISWWRLKMAYVHSKEYPNCLSVEMTAQIKGCCGAHEYHLTEPRRAAGLMGSWQFIQVGSEKTELTSDSWNLPLLKICGHLQIFLLIWRDCPH